MAVNRIFILVASIVIAGCSNQGLRDLRSISDGPDEFMVLPVLPLSEPQNYKDLPVPTPGGRNLTDLQPKNNAIIALGGNLDLDRGVGIPLSDEALVTYANRGGVLANIREIIFQEDEAFRKRRGRFSQFQLFRVNRYDQVYAIQKLDPFVEKRKFRRAGITVPSAPPEVN